MANFAELDNNNKVLQVLVVDDKHCGGPDDTGDAIGQNFLRKIFHDFNKIWKRTSKDTSFRARLAGKDYTYDPVKDIFVSSQPYPSWILNETTYEWDPPVLPPVDVLGRWDEASKSWLRETERGSGIWE